MLMQMRTIFSCMWPGCTKNHDSLEDIERHVRSHLGPKQCDSIGDEDFYYEETEVDDATYLAIFNRTNTLPLSPSHNSDGLSSGQSFASSSPATSPVCCPGDSSSSSSSSSSTSSHSSASSCSSSGSYPSSQLYANSLDWNHFLADHNQLLRASSAGGKWLPAGVFVGPNGKQTQLSAMAAQQHQMIYNNHHNHHHHHHHQVQVQQARQLQEASSSPQRAARNSSRPLNSKKQQQRQQTSNSHHQTNLRHHNHHSSAATNLSTSHRRAARTPANHNHLSPAGSGKEPPVNSSLGSLAAVVHPQVAPDAKQQQQADLQFSMQLNGGPGSPAAAAAGALYLDSAQTQATKQKHNINQHNANHLNQSALTANNINKRHLVNAMNSSSSSSSSGSNNRAASVVKLGGHKGPMAMGAHQQQSAAAGGGLRRGRGENRKCRKVYGMERRDLWCTQCKWKKACLRFCDQ